jgi:hypothetical protein
MPADNATTEGRLHELYAQADAARKQSHVLAVQLHVSQRKARENWDLIRGAWARAELIQADRLAARTDPDGRRYSAYARLQARPASMPVIEQAKGIIMAKYGWPEDQAFDALRRASQRENIKVRDLAADIVAQAARSAPGQRRASAASTNERSGRERASGADSGGSRTRHRASA